MTINLMLPLVGDKKSTRDYLVTILGDEWPLSIKRLHNIMRKRYSYNVSYQAVFKTVKEMVSQKILKETKEGYSINMEWIKDIHDLTERIRSNYSTTQRMTAVKGVIDTKVKDDLMVLTFETLFDVEKYLYYLEKNFLFKFKGQTICRAYHHDWKFWFYTRAEHNRMKLLSTTKSELLCLCEGSTVLDRKAAEFYNKYDKVKVITGVPLAGGIHTEVFGPYHIQIILQPELLAALEKLFRMTKSVKNLDYPKFIETLEKKSEIRVIITENRAVADEIKKKMLTAARQA